MFGRWDVREVGCSGGGMFRMWDVQDVGCLGCGMFAGMWVVYLQNARQERVKGRTQNAHEAYNSLLRSRYPKRVFYSKTK